jgi:hypothetical protein
MTIFCCCGWSTDSGVDSEPALKISRSWDVGGVVGGVAGVARLLVLAS